MQLVHILHCFSDCWVNVVLETSLPEVNVFDATFLPFLFRISLCNAMHYMEYEIYLLNEMENGLEFYK